MRISSSTFYASSLGGILDQQSAMSRLNQQIASGNKLLNAADNPVAASQVMSLNDNIALSTQYAANQQTVGLAQSEETTILNQFQTSLNSVKGALSSVNSSTDANLKNSVATALSGFYQQIKALANSKDTNGNYIFAGFNSTTQPYDHTAVYGTGTATSPSTTYQGDNGLRQVQIGQGQTIQSNDNLSSVMQSGSASDLLQTIDQAATDLINNPANLQSQLTNAYSVITTALGNLQSVQAGLAARQLQVSSQQTTTQQQQATNENALSGLSKLSESDQASAIVELQMRQTSLQAAESAFASTSKLSVFNYL